MVRWRFLNRDRVEVSPESREHAWKDLIIDTLLASPSNNTFRTMINRANFENFDYNRPLIYEIKNKSLLVTNDNLNRALNRPTGTLSALNIMSIHVFFAFICAILLTVAVAHQFNPNNDDAIDTTGNDSNGQS
ncbi:per os infectivity factor 6 [Alphabaculovirus altersperidaniae]|uniref:Per os infectivity factor 6 n=1 Tax=Spodoptera eridania nucleopolyhedrovirus TaxID=2315721 RepID=A0ABX6TRZ9_9ABAC|nr:per os infectivity factor 6 [Spodoptera eridania nucleopolyhedrovirus]QNV47891.1 per os infectivity factor 6 [Spodoptera eridania nucleopolyhedrovirus]